MAWQNRIASIFSLLGLLSDSPVIAYTEACSSEMLPALHDLAAIASNSSPIASRSISDQDGRRDTIIRLVDLLLNSGDAGTRGVWY
jgi:hypothetical protein